MRESGGTGESEPTSDPSSRSLPQMTLPQHGLTRYLRVRLGVANGVLQWKVPRALLGVVPLGVRRVEVPLGEVASARVRRVLHPFRLLVAAACVAVPPALALWWVAVPVGIFGVWVILVSLGPHLEVATTAGVAHRAAVCLGHKIDAELYLAGLDDLAVRSRQSARREPAG